MLIGFLQHVWKNIDFVWELSVVAESMPDWNFEDREILCESNMRSRAQ